MLLDKKLPTDLCKWLPSVEAVTAIARIPSLDPAHLPPCKTPAKPSVRRRLFFAEGEHDISAHQHQHQHVPVCYSVENTTLVTEMPPTTVVNTAEQLTVDKSGHLLIHTAQAGTYA